MSDYSHLCRWIEDPKSVDEIMQGLPFPVFQDVWTPIRDTGKGKVVLIYDIIKKAAGYYPMRKQTIGDCVAHGLAYVVDAAKSVDIIINEQFEKWVNETATEDLYAGSRVQIGNGRLGNSDGSIGAWAASYVTTYGALPRGKYGNVDLSVYDGQKARKWGMARNGVPKTILDKAREHPILTCSQVRTYAEVRDLISNGYAVTIASMQGFSSRRDSEGFAAPSGSWAHQMSILGVDDAYKRPGVLIQNSWGVWNSGPKRHNQPDGSFWCDADVLERRILSKNDSWAFSGYEGFKPQKLDTRIF